MQWVTAALAAYGAVLSSWLGYLTWQRGRRQIKFDSRFVRGEGRARLEIVVVNTGHRPVALASAHFEQDGGGGYLPTLDETLGFPCTLAEGDSLRMTFEAEDLWPGTSSIVVRGYDRDHRHVFKRDFRQQWESLRA